MSVITPVTSLKDYVLAAGASDVRPVDVGKWPGVTVDGYQVELPCAWDTRSLQKARTVKFSLEQHFWKVFPYLDSAAGSGAPNDIDWVNTMRGLIWKMLGNLNVTVDTTNSIYTVDADFSKVFSDKAISLLDGTFILGSGTSNPAIAMSRIGVEKLTFSHDAAGPLKVALDFIGVPVNDDIGLGKMGGVTSAPADVCDLYYDGLVSSLGGILIGAKGFELSIAGNPIVRDENVIAIAVSEVLLTVTWDRNDFTPTGINNVYSGSFSVNGAVFSIMATLRNHWNNFADDGGVISQQAIFNVKSLTINATFGGGE